MKLAGSFLKSLVKRVGTVDAQTIVVDTSAGCLSATGPDLALVVMSAALREPEGRCGAVDRRQFGSIAGRLTGEVRVTMGEQSLEIVTSKASFQLALSKGSIPAPPALETSEYSLEPLQRILSHAVTAADNKLRFSFEGSVQLSPVPVTSAFTGVLVIGAAGSDGRRLAYAEEQFAKGGAATLLIPVAAVHAINALEGETVRVGASDSMIVFETGDAITGEQLIAKKLSRQFPDFRKLLPADSPFRASVKAADLREALQDLAPIVATDDVRRLELRFAGEKLHLRACVSGSTGEESIDLSQTLPDPYLDDPIEIRVGVNHRHLTDFSQELKEGTLEFSCNKTTDPILIRAGNRSLLAATLRL